MPWSRHPWCAALAAGCFLTAPLAQAHEERVEEPGRTRLLHLGLEGQSVRGDSSVDFRFGLEEERWGIAARLGLLSLNTDSRGPERLHLMDAHVTYALAATERARLRLETGLAAMRRPEATYVGPSLAMSFERCILGALDMEGRLQWVPVPHLQLDGQFGFALHLGVLTLRAGWRGLLLDDRGRVTGVAHVAGLGGLFGGVGLSF